MLPAKNRLRTSKDFAQTTKTGVRATSLSLVVYLHTSPDLKSPQVGLIVNKSIGGSVTRHRVSRQLRHLIAPLIETLPKNSKLVIRVLRTNEDFGTELKDLVSKVINKVPVSA